MMKQRSFTQHISLILFSTLVMSSGSLAQAQTSGVLPHQTAQAVTTQLDSTMSPNITALIQQLKHPQADKRIAAATQLGEMRESAQAAVPYIIPLLQDADPNVRISACQAFQKMQELASAAIPYLIALLNDPNVEVRIWVPYALAEMGDLASAAVPELKRLRHDPNIDVSVGAAMALNRIDRETRTVELTALITAMKDKNPKVRSQATFSLNHMGRFAKDAIPQLRELLCDPRSDVRENAVSVLSNISASTKRATPPIQRTMLERP